MKKISKSYASYGFLVGVILGVILELPIPYHLFTALAGLWYANAIQALKTGRITTLVGGRYKSSMNQLDTYLRDKNPILFWLSILIELALASACLFYLKKEGFIFG